MKFNDGDIVWPLDKKFAIRIYLLFMMEVLERAGIKYSEEVNDPIEITKKYLTGEVSNDERDAALDAWWNVVHTPETMRDFQTRKILRARLAICLLAPHESEVDELGEELSFFFEILDYLKIDKKIAENLRIKYFLTYVKN